MRPDNRSNKKTKLRLLPRWFGAQVWLSLTSWFVLTNCTVDTSFLAGKPCGPQDSCASGYTCVRTPCGEGYLCATCSKDAHDDAGMEDGHDADGDQSSDADTQSDTPTPCQDPAPECKNLDDCTDTPAECIAGQWVCDTGYENPERSCDQRDNDCDGQTDVGLICPLAGNGQAGHSDGSAQQARFQNPTSALTLSEGDLIVTDTGNHSLRRVTPTGTTSTVCGMGTSGYQDGTTSEAQFREPTGLALDADGTILVADQLNHRIRRVDLAANLVTTVAGNGFADYQDGPVEEASFAFPSDVVVVTGTDTILVADSKNHCIRIINQTEVQVYAGKCGNPGIADGDSATARFNSPTNLLLLDDGSLLVAEESSHRIRQVAQDGSVSTLAGDGQYGFADGPLTEARFRNPAGMLLAPEGILVADKSNHRIRLIADQVTTLLGSGSAGLADGPAQLVEFNLPTGLTRLLDGRLVIVDSNNHMLRVVNP